MAKDFESLKQQALVVKNEVEDGANSSERIGSILEDILDFNNDKLIELANNVGLYNVDKHVPLGGGFYTSATARAAVPSDVRKVGLIITYKTDATTSVTEQFIGSDVSGWTTDANWKNVGSEGGNKILEWKTDAATTRKKVPVKERKAGMQISYKPTDSDWVNEQYVGTSFTDTEWVKDSNWEKIPKQKQLTELEEIRSFYNLFRLNGNDSFGSKEEARKFWGNIVSANNLLNVGSIIYYKLSDNTSIIEMLVGSTISNNYYKDVNWDTLLGENIENKQPDYLIFNENDKRLIRNKFFSWCKATEYLPYGWEKTEDGLWYFSNNFASASTKITIPFAVDVNNSCLSANIQAYSEGDNDSINIQVFDKTGSSYVFNSVAKLHTYPISFPIIVYGLQQGHSYEIYIGKSATTEKYYISCPLLYHVGGKPALIQFLHDVDKDLDNLRTDVDANKSNLQGQIDIINGAFTEELKYGKKVENYTTATTALFDNIPFSELEDVNYTLSLKSPQQFKFSVYAVKGTSPFEEIISIDKGTDFSQGYVCPQTINIKSLREQGYDNLKFRTYETGINLDYSICYMKKIASGGNTSDWKNAIASLFGNSIVAKCNGDFEGYYDPSWGGIFATKLGLAKLYARGVGGQTYRWNDNCFYMKSGSTGNYVNRWKVKNGVIDTTAGVVTINTTAEEKQAIEAVLGYPIEIHRGCYCSWDRITSMFPASIKDSINCVCIMGGTNDFSGVEDVEGGDLDATLQPQWSSENQTDTDWVNAEGYYNGGDYDISNTWGAMASCLMKMQVWMPQAKIIVLIPIIRKGVNFNNPVNTNGVNMQTFNDNLRKIADWCNVEAIDMSVCGITQFNCDEMIPDGFHPATLEANTRMGNHLAAKFNCISKF